MPSSAFGALVLVEAFISMLVSLDFVSMHLIFAGVIFIMLSNLFASFVQLIFCSYSRIVDFFLIIYDRNQFCPLHRHTPVFHRQRLNVPHLREENR